MLKDKLLELIDSEDWPSMSQQIDKDTSKDNLSIKYAQTTCLIAGPLEGYKNLVDGCDGANCT
jgi:hypothetical protein